MILDPILRFNWIFYAIYGQDIQHSALLSFFISFTEVCRRGIWTLFRVENEHCTNVGRFRASRDVPLPYDLPSPSQTPSLADDFDERWDQQPTPVTHGSSYDGPGSSAVSTNIEAQQTPPSSYLRRRNTLTDSQTPIIRGIARVGTIINQAHAQDFERKRRPAESTMVAEGLERSPHHGGRTVGYDDSSEDEEDVEEEEMEQEVQREQEGSTDVLRRGEETEDEREQTRQDLLDVGDVIQRRRSALQ